jgi:FkbM family methyltransferase
MSLISYSDNQEDVMLNRVFKNIENGFYIDVGAHHPFYGSVTKAFYERGWRGINIEPVTANYQLFEEDRPEDINLNVAISDQIGELVLYEVVEDHYLSTALSTINKTYADRQAEVGKKVSSYTVSCTTLNAICVEHNIRLVHFLKIDVEGAEKAVLAGFSFDRVRPWVVIVEANEPYSNNNISHKWESLILKNDYDFVYYDGLNKFYIAKEQTDLRTHFAVPVNILDDFISFKFFQKQKETEILNAALEQNRLDDDRLHHELANERSKRESLEIELQLLYESHSWRITAPFRKTKDIISTVFSLFSGNLYRTVKYLVKVLIRYDKLRRLGKWLLKTQPKLKIRLLRIAGISSIPQEGNAYSANNTNMIKELSIPSEITTLNPINNQLKTQIKPTYRIKNIHQFHPGSGYGDAITNAMFLIRNILQNWGFQSEIYVDKVDSRLNGQLKLFSEYVGTKVQLLLVHHSMGFDSIERVLQVPDLKILIYHNITPPELLADIPWMQHYAKLGREQLARYREYVVGSIADSPFNADELTEFEYNSPAVIPLLINIDDFIMRSRSVEPIKKNKDTFTVLFVGRVVQSKGQSDLVRCFAAFAKQYNRACRLVLLGRIDFNGENEYVVKIRQIIKDCGIEEKVLITGQVNDEELIRWYLTADLYVSMSKHEGFCVPMLEAMACDVPILAYPAGSIPWVLGNNEQLISNSNPEYVSKAMFTIATNTEKQNNIVEAQRRRLSYFRINSMREMLANYLGACGVKFLTINDKSKWIAKPQSYIIAGHINGSYSLAIVNRQLAVALERQNQGNTSILPIEGEITGSFYDMPKDEYNVLYPLIQRKISENEQTVLIVNHYPPIAVELSADLKLAFFFWEESIVPEEIINLFNQKYDGMLVSSKFGKKVLIDSGINIPIAIVGLGIDHLVHQNTVPKRTNRGRFRFLHVSSGFPRKGIDLLLQAFADTFNKKDPVELVIKTFPNPHNETDSQIRAMRERYPQIAPIKLIDDCISKVKLTELYQSANAIVLPTRGEGFNLPAAEAMFYGVPVITTAYGAQTDFCTKLTAWLIDYVRKVFDSAFSEQGEIQRRVESGRRIISDFFRWQRTANAISEFTASLTSSKLRSDQYKLAWISTWGVRCGIAEYSHFLLQSFNLERFNIEIYADLRTESALQPFHVISAWQADAETNIDKTLAEIYNSEVDVIVIQYQWGFFNLFKVLKTLADISRAGTVVIITFHETNALETLPNNLLQYARDHLQVLDRIFVHTINDINRLKRLGLVENVSLFPQGTMSLYDTEQEKVRKKLGISKKALIIGSFGFFLPHKGIYQLIKAFMIIRDKYPDSHLMLINAEYPIEDSKNEISRCRDLVLDNGIGDAVHFYTDFKSYEESFWLLNGCDMVVFPYQDTSESSSAAVRIGLSCGRVVLTSPLSIFDELDGVAYKLSGITPKEIAQGILNVAEDANIRGIYAQAQKQWIHEHDWKRVSLKLQNIMVGLIENRRYTTE